MWQDSHTSKKCTIFWFKNITIIMFMVQSLRLQHVWAIKVEHNQQTWLYMTLIPHTIIIYTNDFIIAYVLGLPLFSYTPYISQQWYLCFWARYKCVNHCLRINVTVSVAMLLKCLMIIERYSYIQRRRKYILIILCKTKL